MGLDESYLESVQLNFLSSYVTFGTMSYSTKNVKISAIVQQDI